jgi:hypothetical protein
MLRPSTRRHGSGNNSDSPFGNIAHDWLGDAGDPVDNEERAAWNSEPLAGAAFLCCYDDAEIAYTGHKYNQAAHRNFLWRRFAMERITEKRILRELVANWQE